MYNNNNNKNKLTVSNPIWMLCIYIFCSLILNSVDGKTTTLVFPTNNLKPEDIGWKVIDYENVKSSWKVSNNKLKQTNELKTVFENGNEGSMVHFNNLREGERKRWSNFKMITKFDVSGNCTAVYELRNGNEWVKLGSKRDLETEVEVPFGEKAPELPRVTRGVELPGTAPGYSLHIAPKYKRMFKKDYAWLVGMMEERSPNWNSK